VNLDEWLQSCLCTQKELESPVFKEWARKFRENENQLHRKIWEWCFIAQALKERGMLRVGKRGLGFAVGTEPLASMFCSFGPTIIATDLYPEMAEKNGWVDTNQHAYDLESLNSRDLCEEEEFLERCSFKHVDMNFIPADLNGFDFLWSSCALEHLGTLQHGSNFIYNSMECLKPGGIGVHTTEYNVSSNDDTITEGDVCLYRKRDIEEIVDNLRSQGHKVSIDFSYGNLPSDSIVDVPPYKHDPHLKLQYGKYVITSVSLIIQKRS